MLFCDKKVIIMYNKNYKSKVKILDACLQIIDLELINNLSSHNKSSIVKAFDDFEFNLLNLCEEYLAYNGLTPKDNLSTKQIVEWFCKCEPKVKKYNNLLQSMIELRSDKIRLFSFFNYYFKVETYLLNNYNELVNFVTDLRQIRFEI